ncbi:hypothetical protein GBA65_05065 [Rubrobacter marinus]|uniref:Uncharacterized protein n=1 Tax=Rubrobacter marinus TaxID=2653852 RepID=A0A6G8PUR5_9ACTN|nr:hypothetical protein [Rubrobacter marinus]QIN77992.1 hypothetical protein GBA65_05065 [Rubrobacter marinus]
MSGIALALLFSTVVCVAVGATSIAVAVRERGRGSAAWAWLLPGVAGVVLLVGCAVRLVLIAA